MRAASSVWTALWVSVVLAACGGNPIVTRPDSRTDETMGGGGAEGGPDGPDISLGGETCDDGNNDPDDGCDQNCQVEDGFNCDPISGACYECGNGILEGTEQCD